LLGIVGATHHNYTRNVSPLEGNNFPLTNEEQEGLTSPWAEFIRPLDLASLSVRHCLNAIAPQNHTGGGHIRRSVFRSSGRRAIEFNGYHFGG
jgi:hypothetical protein